MSTCALILASSAQTWLGSQQWAICTSLIQYGSPHLSFYLHHRMDTRLILKLPTSLGNILRPVLDYTLQNVSTCKVYVYLAAKFFLPHYPTKEGGSICHFFGSFVLLRLPLNNFCLNNFPTVHRWILFNFLKTYYGDWKTLSELNSFKIKSERKLNEIIMNLSEIIGEFPKV